MFLKRCFFAFYIVLGLLFNFWIPPYFKPDEADHFRRSLILSTFQSPCGNKRIVVDGKFRGLFENPAAWFDAGMPGQLRAKSGPYVLAVNDYCAQPLTSYVPYAAVLALLNALRLNAWLVFFLGRLTYFAIAVWFMHFLLFRAKYAYKNILILLLFLPVVVQQMTAYSYDPAHLLLGFSLFYLYLSVRKNPAYLPAFAAVLCLFLAVKSGWDIFVLLPLSLPLQSLGRGNRKKGLLKAFSVVMVGLAALLIVRIPPLLNLVRSPSQYVIFQYMRDVNPQAQLLVVASDPLYFLRSVFIATVLHSEYYLSGMIGLLGYMDYSIPLALYGLYIGLFYYVLSHQKRSELLIPVSSSLILLAILIIGYAYIQLLQYLTFTPVGQPDVMGAVGRYFIVFVPFGAVLIYNIVHTKRLQMLLAPVVFASILIVCFAVIHNHVIEKKVAILEPYVPISRAILAAYRKIPVGKGMTYVQAVNNDKRLGGLVFYFDNTQNRDTPYVIYIKDKNCKTVLKKEIFDFNRAYETAYAVRINSTKQKAVCITLASLNRSGKNNLSVYDIPGKGIFEPLYVR